jgi:hypothetical protein
MDFIYGLLGLMARWTEKLSRTRGNGIPMNWVVLIVVAILTTAAAFELADALRNRGSAKHVTVGQIIESQGMLRTHVTVSGELLSDDRLNSRPDSDTYCYAVVDGGKAIWVVANNTSADRAALGTGHVTGMMRRIDDEVKTRLDAGPALIGNVRVDERYVLMANQSPDNPIPWLVGVALGVPIALTMAVSILQRYVIFRPVAANSPISPTHPPPATTENAEAKPRMLASGVFTFNQNPKVRSRFLGIPAVLADMASGDQGLVSNIDASVRFMNTVTKKRTGLWTIVMKSGTISDVQDGQQYIGFKPAPAIRIGYIDGTTGVESKAVISFADDAEQRTFRSQLVAPPAAKATI